jgi:hypothetical protein
VLAPEFFRDWKFPLADKAKEIVKWYLPELQSLASVR